MKFYVYKYESWKNQSSTFRGYIKTYRDSTVLIKTCPIVRTNHAAAERDAKKLMKDIKLGKTKIEE